MTANTTYHMRAKVEYDDGGITAGTDQTFTSGAVPQVIPSLTVAATPGMTPQPGVELVNPVGPQFNAPFATDLKGNVIWTYTPPETQLAGESIYPIKLLPNGHFMCILGTNRLPSCRHHRRPGTVHNIREFDLAGNTVRELSIEDLNTKLAAANYNFNSRSSATISLCCPTATSW